MGAREGRCLDFDFEVSLPRVSDSPAGTLWINFLFSEKTLFSSNVL